MLFSRCILPAARLLALVCAAASCRGRGWSWRSSTAKSAKHWSKDRTCLALQPSGTRFLRSLFLSPTFLFRQKDGTGAWCLCSPQQTDFQAQLSAWSQMNGSSTENKWRVPNFCYTVYLKVFHVQMLRIDTILYQGFLEGIKKSPAVKM